MKNWKSGLLVGLALSAAPLMHADTVISTVGSWNGTSDVSAFGGNSTSTYGETFLAPTDSFLQSFTFYIEENGGSTVVDAQVYAWTGNLLSSVGAEGAIGPALFDSGAFTISGSSGIFMPLTVNTGGVALTPGDAYVILLTTPDQSGTTSEWGLISGHPAGDGGGGFNFANTQTSGDPVNNGDWGENGEYGDFGDLAYSADFSPSATPEPGSLTLLGTGLLGIAGVARRRIAR